MKQEIKIEDLGWDDFFESSRVKLGLGGFQIARVIAEHKGAYKIKNESGEYLAKITGKQMFDASSREDFPAVGDWVAIVVADEEHATIQKILPRKTVLKRKYSGKNDIQVIAANVDVAFVIESVDRDFSLNRFERYFAIAQDGGVQSAIILNKTDLLSKEELDQKLEQIAKRFPEIVAVSTSTVTNNGLWELEKNLKKNKTYCFLGSSGVGKSTLINKLLESDVIKTKEISSYSERGKHTTTKREMYFLENGSIIIDNPGVREVGMTDVSAGIDDFFDEILLLAADCKYADCTHTSEPGCAVLKAVEAGQLDKSRYANYISLKKEAEHYEMTEFEKKEKNRQFGKFIKKAKKGLKDVRHKDF